MELDVVQVRWLAECQAQRWSASSIAFFPFFFKFIFGCAVVFTVSTGFLWWRAGLLVIAACGLLISVVSLAAERRL